MTIHPLSRCAQLFKYEALGLPCDRATLDAVALAVYADSPCVLLDPLGVGRQWLPYIVAMRESRAEWLGFGFNLTARGLTAAQRQAREKAHASGSSGSDRHSLSLCTVSAPYTSVHTPQHPSEQEVDAAAGADHHSKATPGSSRKRGSDKSRARQGTRPRPASPVRSQEAGPSINPRNPHASLVGPMRPRAAASRMHLTNLFIESIDMYVPRPPNHHAPDAHPRSATARCAPPPRSARCCLA